MDEDERYATLRRFLALQHSLRTVVEAAEMQAELAKAAGHDGFAMAIYMLRESVLVYSKELSRFVSEYIGEAD